MFIVAATAVIVLLLSQAALAGAPVGQAAHCTKVRVGQRRVCLAVGRRCSRRFERTYARHNLTCQRSRGTYRLRASKSYTF